MEEYFFYGTYGIVVLILAYYDLIRQEVPDIVNSFSWTALAITPDPVGSFAIAGLIFGTVYFFNSIHVFLKRGPIFGWGDVLGLPIFMVFLILTGNPILFVLAIAPAQLLREKLQKKIAIYPFVATIYFISLISKLI